MDQDAGRRVQELSLARRIRRALDWPIWGGAGQEIHCATKGAPQEGEVPGRINRFVKEIRDPLRRKIYLDIVRGFHPRLFHSTPLGSARSRNGAASVGFTHGYFIRLRRGRNVPGIAPRPWVSPTAISFDPVGVGTFPEWHRARGIHTFRGFHPRLPHSTPSGSARSWNRTASGGFTHGYLIRPRWGRHDPGMAPRPGFHPRLFHSTPLGSARSRNAPRPWVSPTAISFDTVGVGTIPESHLILVSSR